MKVLITGHKGFIGTHLAFKLIVDRPDVQWLGYDLQDGVDIRDKFKLYKTFQEFRPDVVIHLAARAGVRTGNKYPDEYISTNIIGTLNLLDLSKEFHVKHFIFFSSSSVYGDAVPPNNESQQRNPRSLYAVTKCTGEDLCSSYTQVPTTVIRPFTVYGENGRPDQVIYKWINQIKDNEAITFYGDGTSARGYTYVGDLVEGVLSVLDKGAPKSGHEVYNLGGQEVISLNDLHSIFTEKISGFKTDIQPREDVDVAENWADISKAKEELGYNPDTVFVDKVKQIISNELGI